MMYTTVRAHSRWACALKNALRMFLKEKERVINFSARIIIVYNNDTDNVVTRCVHGRTDKQINKLANCIVKCTIGGTYYIYNERNYFKSIITCGIRFFFMKTLSSVFVQ